MIQTGIWRDADFLRLTPSSRFAYLMLLTQTDVGTTGHLTIAPTRWQAMLGCNLVEMNEALDGLADAGFIWIDKISDELVIRSWVKHNTRGSKLEAAAKDQFHGINSDSLRAHLQDEYPHVFEKSAYPISESGIPYIDSEEGVSTENGQENGDSAQPSQNDTLSAFPVSPIPENARGTWVEGRGKGVQVVSSSSLDRHARDEAANVIWAEFERRAPRSAFTKQRRATLNAWLKTYPVETLVAAIIGNHLDPHCNGDNDRGQEYHSFELIFRDAKHIEQYSELAARGAPRRRATGAAGIALELAAEAHRQDAAG